MGFYLERAVQSCMFAEIWTLIKQPSFQHVDLVSALKARDGEGLYPQEQKPLIAHW